MSKNPILQGIENQNWLAPLEDAVQTGVLEAYDSAGQGGKTLKAFLHGKWLGHPLHPVITDVPVGSWTATVVLDALEARGGQQYAAGADVTLVVGILGAVGAAVTGITDWSETKGNQRRVGIVHGLTNSATLVLYVASLIARKMGHRRRGRTLSTIGYVALTAGAYLGGELTYTQKVGVKDSGNPTMTD